MRRTRNNTPNDPLLGGQRPAGRTRIGAGRSLFLASAGGEPLDGRTVLARVFKDVLEAIVSDLGGRDALSEGEFQLARRAAALSVQCMRAETFMAAGRELDIDGFCRATTALNRALLSLGLRRRQKDVTLGLAGLFEEVADGHGE